MFLNFDFFMMLIIELKKSEQLGNTFTELSNNKFIYTKKFK